MAEETKIDKSWGVFYNGNLSFVSNNIDEASETANRWIKSGGRVWLLEIFTETQEIVDSHLFSKEGGQSLFK